MLVTRTTCRGTVQVDCDHCNTRWISLEGDQRDLSASPGGTRTATTREIVDSTPCPRSGPWGTIYECVRLALPIRRVHAPGSATLRGGAQR